MQEPTKRRLTKDDITILVKGKEVELKSSVKSSLANIINELIDFDSFSSKEPLGDWLNNPRARVAKYLRGIRAREGLTQQDVCKKLGIGQGNLSKIEKGERPVPRTLIKKIAQLYGVKVKMIDEKLVEKSLTKK